MKNFSLIHTLLLILFVASLLYPYLLFSLDGIETPTWAVFVSLSGIVLFVAIIWFGPKSLVEVEKVEIDDETFIDEVKEVKGEIVKEGSLFDVPQIIKEVIGTSLTQENKQSEFATLLMSKLSKVFEIGQGAMYFSEQLEDKEVLVFKGGYAYHKVEEGVYIDFGEGLTGQVAKAKKKIELDLVPEGYITIFSGLGESTPSFLYIYPIIDNDITLAVIEMASFTKIDSRYIESFENEISNISKYIKENL